MIIKGPNRFLFLIIIFFIGCDLEGSYKHPCAGHYGSENVIDSIVRRYNLKNATINFHEWYKDQLAMPNNCDTIHLILFSEDISFIRDDTFAISIGSIFFNDSSNKDVKFLHISAKDIWPAIGNLSINYLLDKKSFQNYNTVNHLVDSDDMQYSISSENFYENANGGGVKIRVNVPKDYGDIKKLAFGIKEKYKNVIKDKALSEFQIFIMIQSPSCKLCTDETYYFFYDKLNKNI
jgi:hypothetical protein